MSKTIWKYNLPRDGETIEIHQHIVEVLHIGAQDGIPRLWAIVDPDLPREGYTEVVAWGTGWPLPDDVYQECDYWGSCEDWQGYIWHYFAEARFPERNNWTNVEWNELSPAQNYPEYLKGYSLTTDDDYSARTITVGDPLVLNADGISIDWNQLNKLASITTTDLGSVTATTCAYL